LAGLQLADCAIWNHNTETLGTTFSRKNSRTIRVAIHASDEDCRSHFCCGRTLDRNTRCLVSDIDAAVCRNRIQCDAAGHNIADLQFLLTDVGFSDTARCNFDSNVITAVLLQIEVGVAQCPNTIGVIEV
jgi:hypothetical protein